MSTRIRNTANGTEIWDAIAKVWRPVAKHEAQKMLANSLFPRSYHPRPKPRVSTLSAIEVRAGKGGR